MRTGVAKYHDSTVSLVWTVLTILHMPVQHTSHAQCSTLQIPGFEVKVLQEFLVAVFLGCTVRSTSLLDIYNL